jgi:putative transposase
MPRCRIPILIAAGFLSRLPRYTENSHQPTRRRERIMKRFKSPRQVQRFLSAHDQVANVFPRRRDHDTAANLGSGRTQAFATWADVTGVAMAA